MKPWQVVAIVLFAVVGVALVVYFATRRAPTSSADDDENGSMDNETADTIEGVGNLATGLAAGIARIAS